MRRKALTKTSSRQKGAKKGETTRGPEEGLGRPGRKLVLFGPQKEETKRKPERHVDLISNCRQDLRNMRNILLSLYDHHFFFKPDQPNQRNYMETANLSSNIGVDRETVEILCLRLANTGLLTYKDEPGSGREVRLTTSGMLLADIKKEYDIRLSSFGALLDKFLPK